MAQMRYLTDASILASSESAAYREMSCMLLFLVSGILYFCSLAHSGRGERLSVVQLTKTGPLERVRWISCGKKRVSEL